MKYKMISNISLTTLTFCVKSRSVFQPFCFGGISFVDFYGVTGIVWGLSDETQIGARLEKDIEMSLYKSSTLSNLSLITLTFCVKPCSVFQPFCFGGISFVDFYGVKGIVWGLSDEKQIGARLEKEIEM